MLPPVILIIGGIALFFGLVIFVVYQYEKKRTEHFKSYALQHGYSFVTKKEEKELTFTTKFKIFMKGHSRRINNYMSGRKRGVQWDIFDYKYTIGGGKHSQTYNQTIAAAKVDKTIPTFIMAPEYFFHRFAEKFGYQDIDFDSNPVFSKKYLLKSDDSNIKNVFNPDVLNFFEQVPGTFNVEAQDKHVLVYRVGKRAKRQELNSFIDIAGRIVDKISR